MGDTKNPAGASRPVRPARSMRPGRSGSIPLIPRLRAIAKKFKIEEETLRELEAEGLTDGFATHTIPIALSLSPCPPPHPFALVIINFPLFLYHPLWLIRRVARMSEDEFRGMTIKKSQIMRVLSAAQEIKERSPSKVGGWFWDVVFVLFEWLRIGWVGEYVE
eukprot:1391266-Amorphochlora_amoeboformis.AAC.1